MGTLIGAATTKEGKVVRCDMEFSAMQYVFVLWHIRVSSFAYFKSKSFSLGRILLHRQYEEFLCRNVTLWFEGEAVVEVRLGNSL